MMLNIAPPSDQFRRDNPGTWTACGVFDIVCIPGAEIGLRRFEQFLVAVETGRPSDMDLGDYTNDLHTIVEKIDIPSQIAIIVCVIDPSAWTNLNLWNSVVLQLQLELFSDFGYNYRIDTRQLRQSYIDKVGLDRANPFSRASCNAAMFFGRENELNSILSAPATSFAVLGPRRIGKSSLLLSLRRHLAKYHGQVFIDINCSNYRDKTSLALALLHRISPRSEYEWGRVRRDRPVEEIIISAASRLGIRGVVTLDEFDHLCEESVFSQLKHWFTGTFRGRLRFVVAGYNTLRQRIKDAESSLFNVFDEIPLGPFSPKEAKYFIDTTFNELGLSAVVNDKVVDELLAFTGAYPWIIQECGSRIIATHHAEPKMSGIEILHAVVNSVSLQEAVIDWAFPPSISVNARALAGLIAAEQIENTSQAVRWFRQHGVVWSTDHVSDALSELRFQHAISNEGRFLRLSSDLLQLALINTEWHKHYVESHGLTHGVNERPPIEIRTTARKTTGEPILRGFISYCHADQQLVIQFKKSISMLEREMNIEFWYDRAMAPGDEWEKMIHNELNHADLVILVVTNDFLSSQPCYEIEMKRALERQAKGATVVVPIIFRACRWQGAPFAAFEVLPTGSLAIESWHNKDEAFASVAADLEALILRIQQSQEG
jgi:hypothetical protein